MLTYTWDPESPTEGYKPNLDLSMPHPADMNATVFPAPPDTQIQVQVNGEDQRNGQPSPTACLESVTGQEIWVYGGSGGLVVVLFLVSSISLIFASSALSPSGVL